MLSSEPSVVVECQLPKTTTGMSYDERRRLKSVTTYRGVFERWTTPGADYVPAPIYPSSAPTTFPLLLQDADYEYVAVDNPVEIRDWRLADEWPAGAQPVTRKIQYDLYRVSRVDHQYDGASMRGRRRWLRRTRRRRSLRRSSVARNRHRRCGSIGVLQQAR